MRTEVIIPEGEIALLKRSLEFDNRSFAATIMDFLSKYPILTHEDLAIITDKNQCSRLFHSSCSILLEIVPGKSLPSQITDRTGRKRYYETVYAIGERQYVITSQLYGNDRSLIKKDQRKPFLEWILAKLDSTKETAVWNFEDKKRTGGEIQMSMKEKVAAIKAYIAAGGFHYEGDLIENFYLSLKSKPFVILAGTSGTGKTRLVKLFAQAIGAQMKLVPVRPDWSDSSDLFGHTDLSGNFRPGVMIDFIKEAEENPNTPYFLCLDEMNLARVEYYLSDFLSIMETRDRKIGGTIETEPLVDESYFPNEEARKKYGRVFFPENLYVIGTVNMDETTFPFSKKVLDRANTIEFSFVNLMARADLEQQAVAQKLDNSFLKTDYLYLRDCDDEELIDSVCFTLEEWNQILMKANLHVGYRVRDEISFYMMHNKRGELLGEDVALDHQIMQKILPRVQGSSGAIKEVLSQLFIKCAGDYTGFAGISDYEQMDSYLKLKICKYPHSAKKIAFMMRRYEEDGFTSYWL